MKQIREQLQEIEGRLRTLREDRARVKRVFDAAKAAAEEHESEQTMNAGVAAKESLQSVDRQIEAERERQTEILRQIGDVEAGMSGFAYPGVSGWETAARKLDLARGELRVDVAAQSLLAMVSLPTSPSDGASPLSVSVATGGATALPGTGLASNRWLYPVLQSVPIPEVGGVVSTDFTIAYAEDQLTGGIEDAERDPDSVAEKPVVTADVALAEPKVRLFPAVLENVPSRIFDSQQAVRTLLGTELSRLLSESFDSYVVGVIEAASPPSDSTGSDLISQIRNAIADMHDLGGEPTVIALTPSDAATLDLSTDDGGYVFIPGTTGQSVVWRLLVREVPSVTSPTLIDSQRLGLIYTGEGSVLLDPYSSMTTNQVRARVEAEAVMHVRDIQQGAFQIA
jgi:hypothetical protein